MKTQKQLETIRIGNKYLAVEIDKLDELVENVLTISNAYEPLLGDSGPGNTHGDNMEVMWYGKHIMNRINDTLEMWRGSCVKDPEETKRYNKYKDSVYNKLQGANGFKFSLNTRY
jgi:hypothetical protein